MIDDERPGTFESFRNAARELWRGLTVPIHRVNRWLDRRGFLFQATVMGVIALGLARLGAILDSLLGTWLTVPSVTTNQLLVVLIGAIAGQSYLQVRGFNSLRTDSTGMETADVRTDGGESDRPETSGGLALAGAIAGAALGASYGTGGVAGGALLGYFLGDELERHALRE